MEEKKKIKREKKRIQANQEAGRRRRGRQGVCNRSSRSRLTGKSWAGRRWRWRCAQPEEGGRGRAGTGIWRTEEVVKRGGYNRVE